MSRGPGLLCVIVGCGAALAAAQQNPGFRSGTHTVSVYATATDGDGRLVTDLTRSAFEVYDNGIRQEITVFASDPQPITIVAMLDRSGSVQRHFDLVREAAGAFVDHLMPGDRARIGSFSDRIEIHPETFTSDPAELHDILDERLQDSGPTPLWNATAAAMDALAGEEGRRVLLVFTDGRDTPSAELNVTFDQVRARAEAEEVMVYGIGLSTERCGLVVSPTGIRTPRYQGGTTIPSRPRVPGQGGPITFPRPRIPQVIPPPRRLPPRGREPEPRSVRATECVEQGPDPNLRELAAIGGGGYFELDLGDDLPANFARVADELHHQYLLAFPAAVLDGAIHQIEVRVREPGVEVRARRSYLASPR